MPVTESNPKAFQQLLSNIKELDGLEGKVGWFESAQYEDGTPVAQVAQWNEEGNSRIPPRPFFRPAQMENSEKWMRIAAGGAKQIVEGKATGLEVMEILTTQAEADVLQAIVNVTSPPLSPLTILARWYKKTKGEKITGKTLGYLAGILRQGQTDVSGVSTKPLNDTGHMMATLSNKVEQNK